MLPLYPNNHTALAPHFLVPHPQRPLTILTLVRNGIHTTQLPQMLRNCIDTTMLPQMGILQQTPTSPSTPANTIWEQCCSQGGSGHAHCLAVCRRAPLEHHQQETSRVGSETRGSPEGATLPTLSTCARGHTVVALTSHGPFASSRTESSCTSPASGACSALCCCSCTCCCTGLSSATTLPSA